jgi:hypothetical protein
VNNQFLLIDQFFCGINNFVLNIVRVCIGILQINLDKIPSYIVDLFDSVQVLVFDLNIWMCSHK